MHLSESEQTRHIQSTGSAFLVESSSRGGSTPATGSSASPELENGPIHATPADAPFLIFRLGSSIFGVPALQVRTIHTLPALSPLQESAAFIVGVFNLRGAIVPVMDLNARFGRESPPYGVDDSLVVLNWDGADVAVIVHEVRAVERIPSFQVQPAPAHSRRHDLPTPFVEGVAQLHDDIVMLLNLQHLLHWAEPDAAVLSTKHSTKPISARRFASQNWTTEERSILEARAARLRLTTSDAGGDAHSTATHAPVAIVALGGEEFGFELESVREFALVNAVAAVPCCPPHILGQINLRGDIVTLVDVRQTLRTARTAPPYFEASLNRPAQNNQPSVGHAAPVVVVLHEGAPVGIVVDELRGVLYLREDVRQALDTNATGADNGKYFAGGALHEGRLLPLLDVARLLNEGGLAVEESV